MSKDQWVAKHEQACEDFAAGKIEEDTFRAELKRLGFDQDEIDEQCEALWQDRPGARHV